MVITDHTLTLGFDTMTSTLPTSNDDEFLAFCLKDAQRRLNALACVPALLETGHGALHSGFLAIKRSVLQKHVHLFRIFLLGPTTVVTRPWAQNVDTLVLDHLGRLWDIRLTVAHLRAMGRTSLTLFRIPVA
eukprot:5196373-Amphidinium_carterae.1